MDFAAIAKASMLTDRSKSKGLLKGRDSKRRRVDVTSSSARGSRPLAQRLGHLLH